ncbi:Uncharacterised protein [Acinetobacter baumannii]|jgi:hypothetical protein|nr:Uncharacterised protein [Acinetobacter baumannii]
MPVAMRMNLLQKKLVKLAVLHMPVVTHMNLPQKRLVKLVL